MHERCACGESDAMPFHQIETFSTLIATDALRFFTLLPSQKPTKSIQKPSQGAHYSKLSKDLLHFLVQSIKHSKSENWPASP